MQIEKEFTVAHGPDVVWGAFSDVRLVASCLPGAAILAELGDDRYRGQFSVKVGPLAASFEGDVTLKRDDAAMSGHVEGKGADAKSNSRASGSMTYRVLPDAKGSRVAVDCTINLAGALAQFGKAGVVKEIANRITAEFVRNLEAQLAARVPVAVSDTGAVPAKALEQVLPPPPAQSLDAGRLLWSIVRDAIVGFFRALIGRRNSVM
ncbi:SRPBCC family protein [Ferrovibrio sp.]|uniref:SRPBCC family protein n=1 Tax=Ferrovibrio sp. TaxID=1917215 RepID=UPI003D0CB030